MGNDTGAAYVGFASIYDSLMREVDYDAWARYIMDMLPPDCRRVAECACGTGEISVRLAKRYELICIDISREMLDVASAKARRRGLKLPFICQDMRAFVLHRPVDAIVCACDGVNYLTSIDDALRFFKSAAAALVPGGSLCFDISSRYKLQNVLGANGFSDDTGDAAYIWRNCYDDQSRLIEMTLSFFKAVKGGANLYERFEETHIQRAHTVKELTDALRSSGFADIRCFDAFTFEPARDNSERIQFFAKKAGES